MNPFYCIFKSRAALIFALLPAFVAGCGGGGSLDPILGTPSVAAVATLTDTTRPTVVLTAPGAGAVAVAINRRVTATFSEGMSAATLTGTSFTLRNTTLGAAVAGTVSYSAASRTATFAPTGATLAINSLFTATITTAATDSAGNALAGNAAVAPGAGNHVWTLPPAPPQTWLRRPSPPSVRRMPAPRSA